MDPFSYDRRNDSGIPVKKPDSLLKYLLKSWFNRKEFFTFMVIPHTSVKSVKSVRFPKWIISSFVVVNIIMFSIVCVFGVSYYTLNKNLENKKAEYESLQVLKEHDEQQLDEYKANEKEIVEKIRILKNLEVKLRDIIETKKVEEPQAKASGTPSGSIKLASRGMGGSLLPELPSIDGVDEPVDEVIEFSTFDEMYETVDELVEQVDAEIQELDEVIKEAEAKLKAMMAKPLVLPTYGKITSPYGYRKNPFGRGYEFHPAIDIANSRGTPIKASGDGVVTISGWEGGYGYLVKINHQNGYESLYGHNSKLAVKVGQRVKRGDVIAYMGSTGRSTGNHCHFEVRLYGKAINPRDVK